MRRRAARKNREGGDLRRFSRSHGPPWERSASTLCGVGRRREGRRASATPVPTRERGNEKTRKDVHEAAGARRASGGRVSLIARLGRVGPERESAEEHVGPKARLASAVAAGLRLVSEGWADFETDRPEVWIRGGPFNRSFPRIGTGKRARWRLNNALFVIPSVGFDIRSIL